MERPPWLDDETELLTLLNELLNKLDRKPAEEWKQLPAIRLIPGRFKKLFRNDEASDQSWLLLTTLQQKGLIRIQPDPKRNSFDPLYQSARVALPPEAEETCGSGCKAKKDPLPATVATRGGAVCRSLSRR